MHTRRFSPSPHRNSRCAPFFHRRLQLHRCFVYCRRDGAFPRRFIRIPRPPQRFCRLLTGMPPSVPASCAHNEDSPPLGPFPHFLCRTVRILSASTANNVSPRSVLPYLDRLAHPSPPRPPTNRSKHRKTVIRIRLYSSSTLEFGGQKLLHVSSRISVSFLCMQSC